MPFSHPKTKTQTKTSVFLANPNRHCRAAGHGTAREVLDIARTTRPRDAMLDGKNGTLEVAKILLFLQIYIYYIYIIIIIIIIIITVLLLLYIYYYTI